MPYYQINDLETISPVEGVEMRAVHGEKMSMVFFSLEAGAGIPEHSHPHEQMGTLMSGMIELVIGDEKYTVMPGDSYHVPSNVPHTGQCLERAELVEVFSPARKEFPGS